MYQPLIRIIFVGLFFFSANYVNAQSLSTDRINELKTRIEVYSYEIPNLNKKISATVSGVSLFEFLRGISVSNKLNINVDPSLDTPISINLYDVTISDLLVHICKEYNTELLLTGENILSLVKYIEVTRPIPTKPKELKIKYFPSSGSITYDLRSDTLSEVLKYITQQSNINIVASQKIRDMTVNGYVEKMPIKKALSELAHMNGLFFLEKDSSTIYFEDISQKQTQPESSKQQATVNFAKIQTNQRDSIISINLANISLKELLPAVTAKLNVNYFLFSDLKGTLDVKVNSMSFPDFLNYIFKGTDYTFKYTNGIYLIGERKLEGIRSSTVYKLMYRTTTKILEAIPSELKKGIEVIPLTDLNSLILSGSTPAVTELEVFLRQIDKNVPVVNIELVILDITKSHSISTGISAGRDNSPTKSVYNSVFPAVDVKLGANTINEILNSINGSGLINLGTVNSNFYLSLKAAEDNGSIKIRSTPKLSTLNGTDAQMAIGETRYYAETTANVIATQSTTTVSAIAFKPLQANLSVTIKPIVSGDEQITLDISVDQGSFTNQISANGPFGQTTRSFRSSIRVKNNEMILLGGLEQKSNNNSGRGVPFLSRIPVLKWLFSSRTSSDSKTKLAILIHPTVIF